MKHQREVWKRLIAIEGIDGAGTTTLSKLLCDAFRAKDCPYESGNEPTDGPIGRLIRSALSGATPLSRGSLALLFAADRREHLYGDRGIRSILDTGKYYLTDRYFFSSLAYQTIDNDWDWVYSLNETYPLPEYLIFLGLPVDHALKRIETRSDREIFEYKDIQLTVAENYRKAMAMFDNTQMKILELDATDSPQNLCNQALAFLELQN